MRHTKSRSLWLALETSFAQQSQAKILFLQQQLTNLKRKDDSVMDYYHRASLLFDSLAAAGSPISETQFNNYFMAGLGGAFETIVTALYAQNATLISENMLSQLLMFEARQKNNQEDTLPTNHSKCCSVNTTISKSISVKSWWRSRLYYLRWWSRYQQQQYFSGGRTRGGRAFR